MDPGVACRWCGRCHGGDVRLLYGLGVALNASAIAIVSGAASVSPPSSFAAPEPASVAAACTALTTSAGTTDPASGDRVWPLEPRHAAGSRVVRRLLPAASDADRAGQRYTNARIDRSSDGNFFDGIVDKVDASGRVADVILAFAGAQGGADARADFLGVGAPNWLASAAAHIGGDPSMQIVGSPSALSAW